MDGWKDGWVGERMDGKSRTIFFGLIPVDFLSEDSRHIQCLIHGDKQKQKQ